MQTQILTKREKRGLARFAMYVERPPVTDRLLYIQKWALRHYRHTDAKQEAWRAQQGKTLQFLQELRKERVRRSRFRRSQVILPKVQAPTTNSVGKAKKPTLSS